MHEKFHVVPEGSVGTKRAVMIGINYVGQEGELSGCQNDVQNVSSINSKKRRPSYLTEDHLTDFSVGPASR